jgi:hypothetical protein
MRFCTYYIIRPTERLRERLERCDPDVAVLLGEPVLWSKWEGGRTVWTPQDYEAQVKLLFLAHLRSEYLVGDGNKSELRDLLEELLGKPPFDLRVFDRWWTLERFEGINESFEDVEKLLGVEGLKLLAKPQSTLVAAWLTDMTKEKRGKQH